MTVEWRKVAIAEAPLEIIDGDRGTNYPKQDDFASVGHCLFLNAGNVTDAGFSFSDCSFISKDKDAALRKGKAKRHDVVLTTRGTVGNVALYDESIPYEHVRINSGMVLLRPDSSKLSPRFLYQFVRSAVFKERVAALTTGSAQPQLPIRDIRRIEFPLPPLPEQRAIAHILGTLDDKIELNRRRSQTLEAMARALFKDWFVDFGPIRAKIEAREPYLPADLWQLFPDRLDDEGKPEGWATKRISDYLNLAYGKSLPAGKRHQGDVPVYGSGGITGLHNEALVNGPVVIVGRKGTVGSLYWEDRLCFPIDTVFYVEPEAPLPFCYYLLESLPLRDMNTDAAVPGLNRENVYRLEIAAPPDELITAFAETAARFRESIAAVLREGETLAQLRDTLLPKLISGELRIPDAEKFIERAESQASNPTRSVS